MTTNPRYAPITADHNWFAGNRKTLRFTIDTTEDMTAWTMRWQFRLDEPDPDALITKEAADITVTAASKRVDVDISADDTEALGAVNGAHALMRVDDDQEQVVSFGPAVLGLSAVRKE